MKYNTVLFILFFFIKVVNSQELLHNPSFEDIDSNSNGIFNFIAKNWRVPNMSSVDYYTVQNNAGNPNYGVPNNYLGYHPVMDGKAYIGLCMFFWAACDFELITGKLKEKLKKDSLYIVSFNIKFPGDSVWLISKVIQVFLTRDIESLSIYSVYSGNFKEFAQRNSMTFEIDNANVAKDWCKYSNIYKARGGEKYITLGILPQGNISINDCDKFRKIWFTANDVEITKFINKFTSYSFDVNKDFKIKDSKKRQYSVYSYYFFDDISVRAFKDEKIDFTLPPNTR